MAKVQGMKNAFLIKTPLQLLNAIEAKYYFNLDTDDCILVVMSDRKSLPQVLALINKINEWGTVIVLNEVSLFFGNPVINENKTLHINYDLKSKILSKSVFNVHRLNRISHYLGSINYIFIGDVRYIYMKHFMNIVPHNEIVVLDDGIATIKIAEDRKKGVLENKNDSVIKKLKLYSKKIFQGVKNKSKNSLCFFTMFDVAPGENDRVIKNSFEHIRSAIDLLPVSDEVYFIGSPVSETGILSRDECFMHMRRVIKYFSNKKIIYIAHRRESAEKLNMIKNDLNLSVVLFDYPIEYQLALIGPRPKVLASFVSTALDSCRLIFGSKLEIISFKLNLTDSPKRELVEKIYMSYKSSINKHFNVISDY